MGNAAYETVGSTALFVIDIQNDLATDPATRIPHADRVIAAGRELLAKARAVIDSGLPSKIVFVQHEETADKGALVRGSEAWKLVFEPRAAAAGEIQDAPGATEFVISKTTRDTFESNPDLATWLRDAGFGCIIAFGIQSECCVLSTCKGALAAGFEVVLLRGAHSTYDDPGRDLTAEQIEREVEATLEGLGVRVEDWETAPDRWAAAEKVC